MVRRLNELKHKTCGWCSQVFCNRANQNGRIYGDRVWKRIRYCSQSCYQADRANNRVGRSKPEGKQKVVRTIEYKSCIICASIYNNKNKNGTFRTTASWDAAKFCSAKCARTGGRRFVPYKTLFFRKVAPVNEKGCMNWQGPLSQQGYGKWQVQLAGERVPLVAHRVAYLFEHGELPEFLIIRHRCDNPKCVNPQHLVAGTPRDNGQDMIARSWHKLRKPDGKQPLFRLRATEVRYRLSAVKDLRTKALIKRGVNPYEKIHPGKRDISFLFADTVTDALKKYAESKKRTVF